MLTVACGARLWWRMAGQGGCGTKRLDLDQKPSGKWTRVNRAPILKIPAVRGLVRVALDSSYGWHILGRCVRDGDSRPGWHAMRNPGWAARPIKRQRRALPVWGVLATARPQAAGLTSVVHVGESSREVQNVISHHGLTVNPAGSSVP